MKESYEEYQKMEYAWEMCQSTILPDFTDT